MASSPSRSRIAGLLGHDALVSQLAGVREDGRAVPIEASHERTAVTIVARDEARSHELAEQSDLSVECRGL